MGGHDTTGTDPEEGTVQLTARLGGTVAIQLWEDRTRGELWVPAYPASSLVLVDEDFVRTASNNAVETGTRTFQFKAVVPGHHRVVFEKRMGWKFTAEDRRVFLVTVPDGGDASR
ncbi:MAG: protease inhibitor I42 family protein [Nitrospirae bacterium]|nr:protease inhibitor I42 family protein [Nitrospirota bacterium]